MRWKANIQQDNKDDISKELRSKFGSDVSWEKKCLQRKI